jgi:hypothetical protein
VQALPQEPQLVGSLLVSMQVPAHSVCPIGHAQTPFVQEVPPAQLLPQAPQLEFELFRSTQLPEQLVSPALHMTVHWPALQT